MLRKAKWIVLSSLGLVLMASSTVEAARNRGYGGYGCPPGSYRTSPYSAWNGGQNYRSYSYAPQTNRAYSYDPGASAMQVPTGRSYSYYPDTVGQSRAWRGTNGGGNVPLWALQKTNPRKFGGRGY